MDGYRGEGNTVMAQEHERFMRMALEEAAKAKANGNFGVGSIIVLEGSVIARGSNTVTSTLDPTGHAETVALREAGPALGRVDLAGCTLYTTFQPCPMCCGAILISGITGLVIGARPEPAESRWGSYTAERLIEMAGCGDRIDVVTGILAKECADIRF